MAMVSAPSPSTVKVLRAVGQVAVAPDGKVLDPLPDDPMRAAWSRRARPGVLPPDQICGGTRPDITEMLKITRPNRGEPVVLVRPICARVVGPPL